MNTGTQHLNNLHPPTGNVFITGGTGTLGKAFVRRAQEWGCDITVFSRDPMKQAWMERRYPFVRYVTGDVRDYETLYLAMVGHNTVIHAAAQKHIPVGERNPQDTHSTNVTGSLNVAMASIAAGVSNLIGISTDKVVNAANVYGATKLLMERLYREISRGATHTKFTLCRYGNVLGSNGSVLEVWRRQFDEGEVITLTDPDMTRFWISEDDAVNLILAALNAPHNTIVIPQAKSLRMGDLADYLYPEVETKVIGRRPGEKTHETLLSAGERQVASVYHDMFYLPPGPPPVPSGPDAHDYTSQNAERLTRNELLAMLEA